MDFDVEAPAFRRHADQALVASVVLLTGLGMVTLYSASSAYAERWFGDGYYFVIRQGVMAGVGFGLFFLAARVRLDMLRRLVPSLVILAAALCCLTFLPGIGVTKNGASRWIGVGGWSYQPSELVKVVLPLYLAHIFDKKGEQIDSLSRGIAPPVIITTLFALLIYLQNNFSTALFVALNALAIFYFAGVRFRYFLSAIVILAPISTLLVLTREHRALRFLSFLHPEDDPLGTGFQVRASVLTIVSGGFWGKGMGQGTRKIASVPEVHSDFVFSAFAEEWGFAGVVSVLALLGFFAWRGYRAGLRAERRFDRLLALGMVTMILSQALLNIAVVSGSVPPTGVPLPFFSAGGSSLTATLLAAGFVVNVSRKGRAAGPLGAVDDAWEAA